MSPKSNNAGNAVQHVSTPVVPPAWTLPRLTISGVTVPAAVIIPPFVSLNPSKVRSTFRWLKARTRAYRMRHNHAKRVSKTKEPNIHSLPPLLRLALPLPEFLPSRIISPFGPAAKRVCCKCTKLVSQTHRSKKSFTRTREAMLWINFPHV